MTAATNTTIANEVDLADIEHYSGSVRCFCEVANSGYTTIENLSPAQILVDLGKLNIANVASVKRFIERYGVPTYGPFYELFLLSRAASETGEYPFAGECSPMEVEGFCIMLNPGFDEVNGLTATVPNYPAIRFFAPSETARRITHSDKPHGKYGGVISVAETQFCLRQLQNACALLTAANAFEGDIEKIAGYLFSPTRRQAKKLIFERSGLLFLTSHHPDGVISLDDDTTVQIAKSLWSGTDEESIRQAREHQKTLAAGDYRRNVIMAREFSERVRNWTAGADATRMQREVSSLAKQIEDGYGRSFAQIALSALETTFELDLPWRVCANPKCGRLFKQPREYCPEKQARFRTAKHCSASCRTIASNLRNEVSQPDEG